MSLLTIEQLNAGYGKLQILHDLSLSVDAGQFVGIFGPNGSGKSTLIKSIFGLTRVFSGTIKLETVNSLESYSASTPLSLRLRGGKGLGVRRVTNSTTTITLNGIPTEQIGSYGVAYVPQTQNVFTGMTIRENLLLAGRHLKHDQLEQNLATVFETFPILRERQSQRARQLSGGQRQMPANAIAFLPRPRLILLDEPSAGLSP